MKIGRIIVFSYHNHPIIMCSLYSLFTRKYLKWKWYEYCHIFGFLKLCYYTCLLFSLCFYSDAKHAESKMYCVLFRKRAMVSRELVFVLSWTWSLIFHIALVSYIRWQRKLIIFFSYFQFVLFSLFQICTTRYYTGYITCN